MCPKTVNTEKVELTCPLAVADPIHLGIGAKFETQEDFSGPAWWLGWKRFYNSKKPIGMLASYASPWGNGWRSPLTSTLMMVGFGALPDNVLAIRPRGAAYTFSRQPDGTYRSSEDVNDRLYSVPSGDGTVARWRYASASDQLLEEFTGAGALTRITRIDGRFVDLLYADGRLNQVVDNFGHNATFSYEGNLLRSVSIQGLLVQYGSDGHGNLSSIVFPDDSTKINLYDEPSYTASTTVTGLLTGIIDENGIRYSSTNYSAQGTATANELAGGVARFELTYPTLYSSTTVTDPLGGARTYGLTTIRHVPFKTSQSQPGGSGCSASSSNITYDANGNVTSRSDFDNHKTCYANEPTRNLETKRVEGLASGADCTSSLSTPPPPTSAYPVRTITTSWHPDWRLEARRAEPKKITTWVYNGQPDPTSGGGAVSCAPGTALLPDGKPIAVLCKRVEQATTDATGASGFSATVTGSPRTWSWTYNAFGQVVTANGPRTDVTDTTTYTYYSDTAANHTLGDLYTVKDALGHITTYSSYDKNGRPLTIVDPNSLTTTLTYTPRGWLKTRQVGSELTTYDYDGVGQLKKVTAPDLSWIGYDYDPAHRLTDIYDNLGNRITYTLDNAGNRTREDVTDPTGNLARTQTRVYDALSRLQNIIQPE